MEGIVHIAGVMPRIGTTTAALQLTAFLKRFGYNAAYVESNTQDYIWGCRSMYEDFKDVEPGKATCCGLDLYTADWLPALTEGGTHYDYIICDHGNIQTMDFNRETFLKCSAAVLVAGMKPNELFLTEEAMRDQEYQKAIWLFNFIRKEDEAEILKQMDRYARFTSFLPYMPDPFEPVVLKDGEAVAYSADPCFKKAMSAIKYRIDRR